MPAPDRFLAPGEACVGVTVIDGVVSLHGDVTSDDQRTTAEQVTCGIFGVLDVRNALTVSAAAVVPAAAR